MAGLELVGLPTTRQELGLWGWTWRVVHRQNERMLDDICECRTYEEAAGDIGIGRGRVRALAIAGYLDRCPSHQGHVLCTSIEAERSWRASTPWWRKSLRPVFIAFKVTVGVVLEGI